MFNIGQAIGGFVAIAILAAIIERLSFKGQPPFQRAMFTVATALLVASAIAGFGAANGGPYVWSAGLNYLPGAVLVFFWYQTRYSKAWTDDDTDAPDEADYVVTPPARGSESGSSENST